MRLESVNTTWKVEFYLQQMLTLHIIRRKVPLMGLTELAGIS